MAEKPLVSVITVVFNGVGILPDTIQSIEKQSYKNVEYIVVDGCSTDGTIDIIKKSPVITKWISEKDNGLYDAMNKAMKMATGEYIWFINAGDRIYAGDTLEKIFSDNSLADVYYGQTMIVDQSGNELGLRRLKAPEKLSWRSLINGMLVCHQSFIVRRSIAPAYNLGYRISSDYEWMIRCLKNAKTITNTNSILARFLDGGLNKKRMKTGLKERFRIMLEHFGIIRTVGVHLYFPIRFLIFYLFHGRV